jgi:sugar phosphate isomerase/epimerase
MKIALNGATTMRADLETDIKAAAGAGFELIEIWAAKLREFLKTKTVDDLKKEFKQ